MASHTLLTTPPMVVIAPVTAVVMAVQMGTMKSRMAPVAVLMVSATAWMALATVVLMPSQMARMVSPQLAQRKRQGSVMIWNAASRMEPMNSTPTCTTFLMVSQAVDTASMTASQAPTTVSLTVVNTSSTVVMTALMAPPTASATPPAASWMAAQTPANHSLSWAIFSPTASTAAPMMPLPHSMMAPQFLTTATTRAIPAAMAATGPSTGSSAALKSPTAVTIPATSGASTTKAAANAPSTTAKSCTGWGKLPNHWATLARPSATGVSTVLASSIRVSPNGSSAACTLRRLDSICCAGVVVWSNIPCAAPPTFW